MLVKGTVVTISGYKGVVDVINNMWYVVNPEGNNDIYFTNRGIDATDFIKKIINDYQPRGAELFPSLKTSEELRKVINTLNNNLMWHECLQGIILLSRTLAPELVDLLYLLGNPEKIYVHNLFSYLLRTEEDKRWYEENSKTLLKDHVLLEGIILLATTRAPELVDLLYLLYIKDSLIPKKTIYPMYRRLVRDDIELKWFQNNTISTYFCTKDEYKEWLKIRPLTKLLYPAIHYVIDDQLNCVRLSERDIELVINEIYTEEQRDWLSKIVDIIYNCDGSITW